MIADVRTYTLFPRKLPQYLNLFEKHALPVMRAHGMQLDRYFVAKIGPLHQVVHIWNYDSLADLEAKRNARDAAPKWPEHLAMTDGLVLAQAHKIMEDARFSLPDRVIRARATAGL
mgnify:FL=1